jgi:hypothetical protein
VCEIQRPLITYCSNIHPGESWAETFSALREHIPPIKAAVSPQRPFPLGLRLSARAVRELTAAGSAAFAAWLGEHDCFIPTVNGFPFGVFHGAPVKEAVYLPDWRTRQRVDYTVQLATLLAGWLPAGISGSLSTVPVGFKAHLAAADFPRVRQNFLDVLLHLARLRQETGADILLALEPEPGCLLETTADLVNFLARMDFPEAARRQVGICLDCCHLAMAFETPAASLARLAAAGVRIGKVQISSALRLRHDRRQALRAFCEPNYLHQVTVRNGNGELSRYADLPQALAEHRGEAGAEWRCHFHLPLDFSGNGEVQTTRSIVEEILPLLDPLMLLEIETYTWEVLPSALRDCPVDAAIIREIRWLQGRYDAAHCRP